MGKQAKVQSFTSLFLLKPPLLCLVVVFLLPSLVFTYLQGSSFFDFAITVPILILLTSFLVTLTKSKKVTTLLENQVQEGKPRWDKAGDPLKNETEKKIQNVAAEKSGEESEALGRIHEPAGFLSESETTVADNDSTSGENPEPNWVHNGDQNEEMKMMNLSDSVSEDDDDDEDGLIEIAIPNSKPSDFLPESIFNQRGLMQLLADINETNEEENLIEIDISMGSIKC